MKNAQTQHLYIRHAIIHVFYERIKQIFGQQDEVSVGISQKIKENNTLIKIDRNKMVFENSFEIQYIADIISTELLVNELKSNPIKNKYQITLNGYTNHLREGSLIAQGRALYTNFNIIRNNIVNHDENDIGRDRLIANIPTKIFTKKIIQTVRDLEEFPIPMSISDKQNFIKILDNLQDDESIIYDCIKNNISLMKTI